jgi:hypothetical protein
MDYLYDSCGRHIATVANRQLYNRGGTNIGQHLPQYGVFIDRQGRYLGEIVHRDRLLYNLLSPYCTTSFGNQQGHRGRLGMTADPGGREPIGRIRGYMDISISGLKGTTSCELPDGW